MRIKFVLSIYSYLQYDISDVQFLIIYSIWISDLFMCDCVYVFMFVQVLLEFKVHYYYYSLRATSDEVIMHVNRF